MPVTTYSSQAFKDGKQYLKTKYFLHNCIRRCILENFDLIKSEKGFTIIPEAITGVNMNHLTSIDLYRIIETYRVEFPELFFQFTNEKEITNLFPFPHGKRILVTLGDTFTKFPSHTDLEKEIIHMKIKCRDKFDHVIRMCILDNNNRLLLNKFLIFYIENIKGFDINILSINDYKESCRSLMIEYPKIDISVDVSKENRPTVKLYSKINRCL